MADQADSITVSAVDSKGAFWLWVVYNNPDDFPGKFVVRKQGVLPSGSVIVAVKPAFVGDSLEEARAALPKGLVNMGRMSEDDQSIHEVWL